MLVVWYLNSDISTIATYVQSIVLMVKSKYYNVKISYIYIISYTYHYASNYGMSIHFPTIFRVLPFAHHSFETVQSKRLILGLKR